MHRGEGHRVGGFERPRPGCFAPPALLSIVVLAAAATFGPPPLARADGSSRIADPTGDPDVADAPPDDPLSRRAPPTSGPYLDVRPPTPARPAHGARRELRA